MVAPWESDVVCADVEAVFEPVDLADDADVLALADEAVVLVAVAKSGRELIVEVCSCRAKTGS